MASFTVENYLKAIYAMGQETGETLASTGALARRLGVSPGSVTSMLRTLDESGLVEYQAYEGARLTEKGSLLALRVIRRHRLIELFLNRTLGMTWDEVHEEAEHLEHAASDRLIDRIDSFLGFPDRDPHGDPIPDSEGIYRSDPGIALAECPKDTVFVLDRVSDQDPDFLRYLSEVGLKIGQRAEVKSNRDSAGALTIEVGDQMVSLSRSMASTLFVRLVDPVDASELGR